MSLVLLVGCAAQPSAPATVAANPTVAWVQANSEGGWSVRAAMAGPACPLLAWSAGSKLMQLRVGPSTVATRRPASEIEAKASVFAGLVCEAEFPAAVTSVRVGEQVLTAPRFAPLRIVLIADTGCRLKRADRAYQDCNDSSRWPFAEVARSAAAKRPDLVVHVGDIHYRESPCPAERAGCAGSPWGYGEDTWQADFFNPAAELLRAAPWVFVRGNHESCARAGVGWYRYFDARAWEPTRSCVEPQHDAQGDFSEPHAVSLSATSQFIVFDSSATSAQPYAVDAAAHRNYLAQFAQVERLSARMPHNIFLNHHPVLGFGGSHDGKPKPGNAGLTSVMQSAHPQRLFAASIELVLNGHVHLFEALGFSSDHPAALVVGNAGSAMEGWIDEDSALAAQPTTGAVVQSFATHPDYGFATLDATDGGWRLTAWSVKGELLRVCQINGARLTCPRADQPQ